MTARFTSDSQRRMFLTVREGLAGLGYRDALAREDYQFPDWFLPDNRQRTAPLAAFGQEPLSYNSACFSLLLPNGDGRRGPDLVSDFRALGAPFAFEIGDTEVTQWIVGRNAQTTATHARFRPAELLRVFRENRDEWSPKAVLRAKNIAFAPPQKRQVDIFDLGLIPALEHHIRDKLDPILRESLARAKQVHKKSTGQRANDQHLFRLVFRLLAAKVLHDRKVPGFENLSSNDADSILHLVNSYYSDNSPLIEDRETRQAACSVMWSSLDVQNISVEVLAYIYENTFVDEATRRDYGTHSTPYSLARYVVRSLPFLDIAEDDRHVFEPCSGHGIFLIAALQNLRELYTNSAESRHGYFVRMLSGIEIDSFAVEISKLCLLLSDFPNKDSWRIHPGDVFTNPKFRTEARRARFIVGNPPFRDFSADERSELSGLRFVQKPAELLHRVLDDLHPDGSLGFVLPPQAIHGNGPGYRELRERLARRFSSVEVVDLPYGVFKVSESDSALLIATRPHKNTATMVKVGFSDVYVSDRERFLNTYHVSRRDVADKTPDSAADTFVVPLFASLWERLSHYSKLSKVAYIHRGIEWEDFDENRCYSTKEKKGYSKGLATSENMQAFIAPPTAYLNMRGLKGGAHKRAWGQRKVIANAVRLTRYGWRLAAFVDDSRLIATQNFHGLWPKFSNYPASAIAAVLNNPLASAFIFAHEGQRKHNPIRTLKNLPIPPLSDGDIKAIESLVADYKSLRRLSESQRRDVLLQIDAIVLRSYSLSPRMERQLLDYFNDRDRPVACEFTRYYPEEFTPAVPLGVYLSPEFQRSTGAEFARTAPQISDPSTIEALLAVE